MPPKKTGETVGCISRDKQKFKDLLGKEIKDIKSVLAIALQNDNYLNEFANQIEASECVFSYPNNIPGKENASTWFSIYLLKPDTNEKYWDTNGAKKYYFKLKVDYGPKGNVINAAIDDKTATITPPSDVLDTNGMEILNCVISDTGRCVNPAAPIKVKEKITKKVVEKPTASSRDTGSSSSSVPEFPQRQQQTVEDIQSRLETLQINPEPNNPLKDLPKSQMDRSYFENIGSKQLIVDWMIQHMDTADIVKCIQRGSVSADDMKELEQISSSDNLSLSPDDLVAIKAIKSIPSTEVKQMLKAITDQDIKERLNKIKNQDTRKKAIVSMCIRSGINKKYTLEKIKTRKGEELRIVENGITVGNDEINDVLDECSSMEAKRLSKQLMYAKRQSAAISSAKELSAQRNTSIPNKLSSELSQINIINSLNSEDKKNAIYQLCLKSGKSNIYIKNTIGRKGVTITKLYEDDTELNEDDYEDIIGECLKNTSFGRNKYKRVKRVKRVKN